MLEYRGLTLDPFQEHAIRALGDGRSVLVCAPTGTGKTIIADFVVEQALKRGRQVVYTAPIKALSNQKFRDYTRLHGEENVGLVTGDLVIRREAPCRVMTTEILRNMLLAGETLPDLDAVVIDEIHFLDDRERGTTWEEVLIYLPSTVQILGLSATLRNVRTFADWLSSVRGSRVEVVTETHRTVPLKPWIGNIDTGLVEPAEFDRLNQRWAKQHAGASKPRHRHGRRGRGRDDGAPTTSHMDIFDLLRDRGFLPALYFSFSRKATELNARALAARLRNSLLTADELEQVEHTLRAFAHEDTGHILDDDLRALFRKGVAFHHAGAHVQLKALVEELYERKLIKILHCTSTFALGINMPARAVAFDGLRKFDGYSMRPLTTREFLQKAGRAGRRGMDEVGHVVIRMDHADWDEARGPLQTYLRGDPEPVRSSFSLSFNSVVNLLHHNPMERIREIVEKSFLNYSRRVESERMVAEAERRQAAMEEHATKRERKSVDRLFKQARDNEGLSWEEFETRIEFLKRIGYIEEDGSFAAGARALMNIQIEEIFVTELVLSGILEEIDDASLFGLLCAVNKEFGRDVRVRPLRGGDLQLARAATKIRHDEVVRGAEELTGVQVTWCPDMIPLGRAWAQGRSLASIMEDVQASTDVSGDLIGAFRRAKDLVGQLKAVWQADTTRAEAMTELVRRVSRDEVLVVD